MVIEFHPTALSELIDSAGYYDRKLSGLGIDFLNELHRMLVLLNENPTIGAVVEALYRQTVLDCSGTLPIFYHQPAQGIDTAHRRRCSSTQKAGVLAEP